MTASLKCPLTALMASRPDRPEIGQSLGTLSGGEQAKVKMCLLMLTPCNFLMLDEPTNHLDARARESLKTALEEFPGTVLLVSHEERFYGGWAQRVIDVGNRP